MMSQAIALPAARNQCTDVNALSIMSSLWIMHLHVLKFPAPTIYHRHFVVGYWVQRHVYCSCEAQMRLLYALERCISSRDFIHHANSPFPIRVCYTFCSD